MTALHRVAKILYESIAARFLRWRLLRLLLIFQDSPDLCPVKTSCQFRALLGRLSAVGRPGAAQIPADSLSRPATRAPLVIGAYAQGSIIMAHTYAIKHLVASHPTGFEVNLQRQTTGAAPWHGWYKFPKVGLALTYYDFHNPMLGYAFAASPYISKTFSRGPKHDFSFRLGAGLAYLTNPYDQQTNHKNTIASSALNATLQMRLEYDYALTPHLGLLLGLGLNHFSNGATTKPNFGVNLPTRGAGPQLPRAASGPHLQRRRPGPGRRGPQFLQSEHQPGL